MNAKEMIISLSEKIRDHLIAQKRQASVDGRCQYRTHDGRMCAVGCLIPDEFYKPNMEGNGLGRLVERFNGPASLGIGLEKLEETEQSDVIEALGRWQQYHDSYNTMAYYVWCKNSDCTTGEFVSPSDMFNQIVEKYAS